MNWQRVALIVASFGLFQCGASEDANNAAVTLAVTPQIPYVKDYDSEIVIDSDTSISIGKNWVSFAIAVNNQSGYDLTVTTVKVTVTSDDGEIKKSLAPSSSTSGANTFATVPAGATRNVPDDTLADTYLNYLYIDGLWANSTTAGTYWTVNIEVKGYFGTDPANPAGRLYKTVSFYTE